MVMTSTIASMTSHYDDYRDKDIDMDTYFFSVEE